ncbi:unnamed protein product [Boreogadus saida]
MDMPVESDCHPVERAQAPPSDRVAVTVVRVGAAGAWTLPLNRNFGFDSLKNMNHDMEEKGIVGHECLPLEPRFPLPRDHRLGAAGGEGLKRCPATIPFSSMSWFSLLQIDVEVEEPGKTENLTRSFEIHNIGLHSFWL